MPPRVSVLIPILNEERNLHDCLTSVVSQDLPPESYEVIVIDTGCTDTSLDILQSFAASHPEHTFHRIDAHGANIPSALNLGAKVARGKFIVRVDAKTRPRRDYVRRCVELLDRTGAIHVGGTMKAEHPGTLGRVIAFALTHSFGVGNSKHRVSDNEGEDEGGFLGGFRRADFLHHGGYDERFAFAEDDEMSYRLQQRGAKILRTPSLQITYLCRDSLAALWRQYYRYGFYKQRFFEKYGRLPFIRQYAPVSFVGGVALLGVLGLFHTSILAILALALGAYSALGLAIAIPAAIARGSTFLFLPVVFLTLHLSYGLGSISGLLRFALPAMLRRRTWARA